MMSIMVHDQLVCVHQSVSGLARESVSAYCNVVALHGRRQVCSHILVLRSPPIPPFPIAVRDRCKNGRPPAVVRSTSLLEHAAHLGAAL